MCVCVLCVCVCVCVCVFVRAFKKLDNSYIQLPLIVF